MTEIAARAFRNCFNESFKWFAESNPHARIGTGIAWWLEAMRARLEWCEEKERARRAEAARSLAVK
jgi:hypothetical protein